MNTYNISAMGLSHFFILLSVGYVTAQWPHSYCSRLLIEWSGFEP